MKSKTLFSLKSLIILGFIIAVIPLFLAVIYAAFGLRETSALGRTINTQVFEQTKVVRLVLQKTSDIERKARLFVLLSDPAVRQPYEQQSYESTRAAFKQALGELLKLRVDNKIALLVNELSEKETLIYQQIISTTNASVAIDEAFQGMRDASHNLSGEFENHVDHEFNALHQQSETLEEGLLVKGAVLLSVSFLVIVTLLWVISRSLRQLDSSIRRLGSGELAESIVVEGPSDLQYLGNRLEWLRSHLLELEVSKQQFIHNVAREIEQPLASIRESAEMLITNAEADNPQQEIAQRLTDTVDKLKSVSEELIRYSQINTKPDSLRKGSVDMKALLESVLEDFQPHLQAKNLSVKKLVRPVEIDGVAEQLRGIIEQLLANAVTYSPTGGEIRIMLRDSGQQMELEVEDEGQGIAPEDREHVFEPFFRGKTTQSDAGGPGLGLAIVREYVANHQGKAEIIDPREDQQGARFRVQIPLTGDV